MRLDDLVAELDAYFGVQAVRNDAEWGPTYDFLEAPYWRGLPAEFRPDGPKWPRRGPRPVPEGLLRTARPAGPGSTSSIRRR